MRGTRHNVYIGGDRWKIVRCRVPSDRWGDCDYGSRTIRIARSIHGEDLLNTIVHEWMHARFPEFHEESIVEIADQLGGYLHAIGFRQPDDHED